MFSEPLASHQSVAVFIKQCQRLNLLLLLQLTCQSLVRYELKISSYTPLHGNTSSSYLLITTQGIEASTSELFVNPFQRFTFL